MTVRLSSLQAMTHSNLSRIAAAAVISFVLTGASGAQAATAADAASAPSEASAPLAAGSQYTIHPGQSLNDVAIAATQSHDRATLVRASKALFDANPNAFMQHDPSRLRLGSVLTIPTLDATGAAVAASDASGASGSSAASAGAGASTTAATAAAAASGAQAQTAATASASAPQQASAGVASPASAPSTTAGAAASVASDAAGASSVAGAVAPPATPASGAHIWTGAIQPSASGPATGASAGSPSAALQAPTQVSSLQQLLALKSRVLVELQKHGIGGGARPSQAGGATVAGGQASTGTASTGAATGNVANGGAANAHAITVGNFELTPVNLGFAAAIGAALVALLAAFGQRRRKRTANAVAAAAAAATQSEAAVAAETTSPDDAYEVSIAHDPAQEADAQAHEAAANEEALAAEREAEAREMAARVAAEREAAVEEAARETAARETAAREAEEVASSEAAEHEAAAHEASASESAEQEAAAREAAARDAALRPDLMHGEAHDATWDQPAEDPHRDAGEHVATEQAVPEHDATSSELAHSPAPLDPAAELETESSKSVHDEAEQHPVAEAEEEQPHFAEPVHGNNPPQPQIDFGTQPAELHEVSPFGSASTEPAAARSQPDAEAEPDALEEQVVSHAQEAAHEHDTPTSDSADDPHAAASVEPTPPQFPRAAIDAFSGLDFGLPPRLELPDTSDIPHIPHVELPLLHPVAEPEIAGRQAFPTLPPAPHHVAEEIIAGTAGSGAVAGLGAARFGALNLDFDLELPPSPSLPVPLFTPQDLVKIARNKLELASEYIELGDMAGARALIHEVIEANDAATRSEARALLSTLAPLS